MDQKRRRSVPRRRVGNSNLISAGALIYCHSTHRYLFVLRNGTRFGGNWGLPGGKIEPNESVIAGLHRELQEELGFNLSGNKIIPVETFTSDTGNFIYHTFIIPVTEEFIPILNNEHRGYCWVHLDDHPTPLHPGVWRTFNFDSVIKKIQTLESIL